MMPMATAPWIVSDELWRLVEPLLPKKERCFRYPGRKRLPDRQVLCGILFVLHTGIAWEHLPRELGFGSGITCWRRMDEWQRAPPLVDASGITLAWKLTSGNRNDVTRLIPLVEGPYRPLALIFGGRPEP
jgi:hypothetical protein